MSDDNNKAAVPPRTRTLILDAAETLFAMQGYHATTIKQVAARVGVQGPALYKHFSSKREMYEQVLEQLFAPFLQLVSVDPASQGAMVRQHLANPNASRIVQQAALSGGEDLALLVERWYLPFFHPVKNAQADDAAGVSPVTIMAFHSMLLGYLTLAPLHAAIFDCEPLSDAALAELLDLQARFAGALRVPTL